MKKRILVFVMTLIMVVMSMPGSIMAKEEEVPVSFPAVGGAMEYHVTVGIDFDWFDIPSSVYNHKLAQSTLAMVVSAFRDPKVDVTESDHYVMDFYRKAGFNGIESYGYHSVPTQFSVSNTIAYRRLQDEEGEYILLASPICGQGYQDEWMGNFQMGYGVEHEGFALAADQVYERILEYIEKHFPNDRIKVWVGGFSRAAAVSNLLGHRLLEDDRFEDDNIFVFGYATPNTTMDPVYYPQIHNFCGGFDPVPHVPFYEWGYNKHGFIYHLPDRARTENYDELAKEAEKVYHQITGKETGFGSSNERNWLIFKVISLLERLVPNAEGYTSGVQNAVIAAWGAKGSMLDRLLVFANELDIQQDQGAEMPMDDHSIDVFAEEIAALMSLPLVDTADILEGTGGSAAWYELLTSGSQMVYEHFPEVYLSWMLSTDDPQVLFGNGREYYRLVYTGDVDTQIVALDLVSDEDTVLIDTEKGITGNLAAVMAHNQAFIDLPEGQDYAITLKAKSNNTKIQIGVGESSVIQEQIGLSMCNPLTLMKGETLDGLVYVDQDGYYEFVLYLNGTEWVPLYTPEEGFIPSDLLMEGHTSQKALGSILSQVLVVIPYAVFAVILVLYSIGVVIKRMIRKKVDDDAPCLLPGKILLICGILMSISMCIEPIRGIIIKVTGSTATTRITNHTLQRAAELLNIGTVAYHGIVLIYYGLLAILCYQAIHHYLSRIRLIRLSLLLLLFNTITIFLGVSQNTLRINDIFVQAVPIVAIVGVICSTVRTDQDRKVGKRWLPVSRAILFTALLFLVRQGAYFLLGQEDKITVILKVLTGLPAVILSIHIVRNKKNVQHHYTALAMILYLAANGVINVSMTIGILLFIAGHIALFAGFYRIQKPSKLQWIIGAVTGVVFIGELLALNAFIPTEMMIFGSVYALVVSVLIAEVFPINRRLRFGIILLAIANQMLVLTFIVKGNFLFESTELLFYYMASLVLAADPKGLIDPVIPTAGWEYEPKKKLRKKAASDSENVDDEAETAEEETEPADNTPDNEMEEEILRIESDQ